MAGFFLLLQQSRFWLPLCVSRVQQFQVLPGFSFSPYPHIFTEFWGFDRKISGFTLKTRGEEEVCPVTMETLRNHLSHRSSSAPVCWRLTIFQGSGINCPVISQNDGSYRRRAREWQYHLPPSSSCSRVQNFLKGRGWEVCVCVGGWGRGWSTSLQSKLSILWLFRYR